MVAWSNDFLVQTIGLDATFAAIMISIFFLAMLLGRIACGSLVRFCVNAHLLFANRRCGLRGIDDILAVVNPSAQCRWTVLGWFWDRQFLSACRGDRARHRT